MIRKVKQSHLYQLKELALAFTFCGGFIDAYTFTERGGNLVAGQTGNIIFLEQILRNITYQD